MAGERDLSANEAICVAISDRDLDSVRRLVRIHGEAVLNRPTKPDLIPIMVSALYNLDDFAKVLLEGGAKADIRAVDKSKEGEPASDDQATALMIAANSIFSDPDDPVIVIHRLARAGCPIDAQTSFGRTALMRSMGCLGRMRTLIKLGANLNMRDRDGNSAFMLAEGHRETQDLLLAEGASPEGIESVRLVKAAGRGDEAEAKQLLTSGANPNHRFQRTPLTAAARSNNPRLIQLLIEFGADPNLRESPGSFTPIISAASAGDAEAVEILLAAGADPTLCIEKLGNALDYARRAEQNQRNPEKPWSRIIATLEARGVKLALRAAPRRSFTFATAEQVFKPAQPAKSKRKPTASEDNTFVKRTKAGEAKPNKRKPRK